MKKEILMFIIGVLVGAVVTTEVFLIIRGNGRPNMPEFDKSGFPSRIGENGEEREFDKSKFDRKDFEKNDDNSIVESN